MSASFLTNMFILSSRNTLCSFCITWFSGGLCGFFYTQRMVQLALCECRSIELANGIIHTSNILEYHWQGNTLCVLQK